MERMLGLVIERPVAACAGIFGMLCLAAYPLARSRSLLLTTYLGNNLGFAAHYALLGHSTAVTMNLILGVQTVVALGLARWPRLRWAYYTLIPIVLVAAALTWQGWVSLLSTLATMLSTFGRMQANEFALRVLMLASAPVWAAHDLWVGSLPGLLADLSCIVTGGWMLIKHAPPRRTSDSKDTGKSMIPVPLLNPKFATHPPAMLGDLRVRSTRRTSS